MIKSLQDLRKALEKDSLTPAEAVQAFRLLRELEAKEKDPSRKADLTLNKMRFRALARMKSETKKELPN